MHSLCRFAVTRLNRVNERIPLLAGSQPRKGFALHHCDAGVLLKDNMMKSIKSILVAGMLALAFEAPVQAQEAADPAAMQCKDYLALDAAAMMEVTTAFRADPMAGSMLGEITDEEAMMKIMADCQKMPEMTLMDSMHMNM